MKHCHLRARASGPRWATNPGRAGLWPALGNEPCSAGLRPAFTYQRTLGESFKNH